MINYIFCFLFFILFIYGFVRPSSSIYSKLFLIFGSVLGFISVIGIDYAMQLSNFLGVGRAADLYLYLSLITIFLFIFYSIDKHKKQDHKISMLTRKLAILEAQIRNISK